MAKPQNEPVTPPKPPHPTMPMPGQPGSAMATMVQPKKVYTSSFDTDATQRRARQLHDQATQSATNALRNLDSSRRTLEQIRAQMVEGAPELQKAFDALPGPSLAEFNELLDKFHTLLADFEA